MSAVPGVAGHRRGGESGQALLFALVILFIASLAAALVAEDLILRERALQEEAVRMRIRGLLDGALADALAREAMGRPVAAQQWWGDGRTTAERDVVSFEPLQVHLRVAAFYKGHRGAAEATIDKTTPTRPRVVEWWRAHPGG